MSKIPENEKLEEQISAQEENISAETSDEVFSTVFADPTAHKRTAPEKKKGYLLKALAGVLAVAVLGTGTWAVVKFIPEKDETYESPYHEDTAIKEIKSDDIKTVDITNANGTVNFYSITEEVETTDETSSTVTAEVINWYIEGIDKTYTSASDIATFIGQVGSIEVVREIASGDADFGLDKPTATVRVVCKDGTDFTLTIGAATPDNSGAYYGKFSDSDKFYIITSGYCEEVMGVTALQFDDTIGTPVFEVPEDAEGYTSDEGTLAYFDTLTVKSASFDETLVFGTNNDEELSNMLSYVVTSPSTRIAENCQYIVSIFGNGMTTSGAYSFDVSSESLKKFGLDNPDFEATLDIKGKTMTYRFKAQDDGYCAVFADGAKVISKVSLTTDLSGGSETGAVLLSDLLAYKITDFYASWITLYNIADIANLKITANGTVYSFDIAENSDTSAEDAYIIKLNGKEIDCQSFQYLYQYLVSLSCSDFTVEKLSAEPEISFEFDFDNEKIANTVVEFTRVGASRYQYSIDGIDMGKTTSAQMSKFVKYLEKIATGETIEEIV